MKSNGGKTAGEAGLGWRILLVEVKEGSLSQIRSLLEKVRMRWYFDSLDGSGFMVMARISTGIVDEVVEGLTNAGFTTCVLSVKEFHGGPNP